MKTVASSQISLEQQAEIDALATMPDEEIDTSDIPEKLDWSNARRGEFFRPVKKQITLRLDADLIAWFKSHSKGPNGRGYQTDINYALREYVEQHAASS